MRTSPSILLATILSLASTAVVHAQQPDIQTSQILNDQFFTGPLVAISPALPKAGLFVFEPYEGVTLNTGKYLANGQHVTGSNEARTQAFFPFLEYAITDRLSIATTPQINYGWNGLTTSNGQVANDTPFDFKYRFVDQVVNTAIPSATAILGISFPTGPYQKLGSSLDGTGTGVFYVREGGTLQWLFNTYGDHPLRLRLWGRLAEPLNDPTVRDVSVYNTTQGFRGTANPGLEAIFGISPEYALTQKWVLTADIFANYTDSTRVNGFNAGVLQNSSTGSSMSWQIAPAVEYNFSAAVGVLAGVQFSVAGHNTNSYVEPQIALNWVF